MRILFVSHFALPHLGGIEFIIDTLARRMTARGHEVAHLAASPPATEETPYRVHRMRAWNPLEQPFAIPYPFFAPLQLWREVKKAVDDADVVHAQGMLFASTVLALARASRKARVLTEHVGIVPYSNPLVLGLERAATATLGRYSARHAQAIVVQNAVVGEQMRALAPGVRVEHIDNGVDTVLFRPPEPGERERLRSELGWDARPKVLFVARLVEKKGPALAAEAARAGGFDLVFVGPGEPPRNAREYGVQSLGEVPKQRVAELYRAADGFLLPSFGEGFPLAAQEAMASGVPAVVGDDPGYAQTLSGAGLAARQAPLEPQALGRAVNELLAAGAEARVAARAFALRRFDWDVATDHYLSLYEQVRR